MMEVSTTYGRYLAVCSQSPALWAWSLLRRLLVMPV